MLPGVAIFTTIDRLPVSPGQNVAGAKITPVSVPEMVLDEARALAAALDHPIVTAKPFLPRTVGVLATEGLSEKVRDRFEVAVRAKLAWYGSEALRFAYLEDDPDAVAGTMRAMIAEGADLILTAGGNTIDPFDPTIRALPAIDAAVVRLGAPAHPGSMFWYGATTDGAVPIVNLASCSMYSQATVADLVLPWVMAGETVTERDLAGIGYGGLLDRDMRFRFPAYDEGTEDADS
jgi:molybdopterin biosynthesis enzyme